jgi:hypothetical protein
MATNSKTANKLWTSEEDKRLKSLIETSISLDLVALKLQKFASRLTNRGYVPEFNLAQGCSLGPAQAKAGCVMTEPKKDDCEPTDKSLGPSNQSREAERRRIVGDHVMDLREIVKKLRKPFN